MTSPSSHPVKSLPSVDRVLGWSATQVLIRQSGKSLVTDAVRQVLEQLREKLLQRPQKEPPTVSQATILEALEQHLTSLLSPTLIPVYNLTGTVLHTNLGRAPLPREAIDAMLEIAGSACNVEYDLPTGQRGDRHRHAESWLCRLTGAEAAIVVNNNAAAVLLALNSLANRKQVPVSRGELIEIGGAFRMPDIMARAGSKLVEVGTTNRTHLRDYQSAIGPRTALLMKVHTSNYTVQGFTASVEIAALAGLAHQHDLPLIVDLGSGTLVDLSRFGLPPEPTVRATLDAGADLVTFSGDKLLGGPQAGLMVGSGKLISRIKRNPMLRALRVDKLTLAALQAVLRLYADPDRLAEKLPTLGLMARQAEEIEALARRIAPVISKRLGAAVNVDVIACYSQVGSGSLPIDRLPSFAIRIRPATARRSRNAALQRLAAGFRALDKPVIGRIHEGALLFDLRCLQDERAFLAQLETLRDGMPGI